MIIYDNTAVYWATSFAYPGFQFFFRYPVQQFAFFPYYVRIGNFQIFTGLLDATTARGGEGDDGLALEVVGLHECVVMVGQVYHL